MKRSTSTAKEQSPRPKAGRIEDARGRKVTQLDPVAMYLLERPEWIEADVLRAIAREQGVRITRGERAWLALGIVSALLIITLFTDAVVTGRIWTAAMAKSASLLFFCCMPGVIWYKIKRARFGNIAAAMLKHLRCPHCGYDIRGLPTDPDDGATVCPECGCAWRLDASRSGRTRRDGLESDVG
jgi:hypothetical protein